MNRTSVIGGVLAALLLLSPLTANAGLDSFTIKATGDKMVRLRLPSTPAAPDGNGAFQDFFARGPGPGGNAPDQLHQMWWWYRIGDAPRESAVFSANPDWSGDNTREAFNTFMLAPNVRADMYFNVDQTESAGVFNSIVVVTNNTDGPIELKMFSYLDMDLGGTAAGDEASGASTNMDIAEQPWTFNWRPTSGAGAHVQPSRYDVAGFSSIRDSLTDNAKTTLSNAGLPFGPGDFTTAYQWDLTLAKNEIRAFGVNAVIIIPEPGSLALACLGLAALVVRHRHRSRIV